MQYNDLTSKNHSGTTKSTTAFKGQGDTSSLMSKWVRQYF